MSALSTSVTESTASFDQTTKHTGKEKVDDPVTVIFISLFLAFGFIILICLCCCKKSDPQGSRGRGSLGTGWSFQDDGGTGWWRGGPGDVNLNSGE